MFHLLQVYILLSVEKTTLTKRKNPKLKKRRQPPKLSPSSPRKREKNNRKFQKSPSKKIERDALIAIKKWVYWEFNANVGLSFVTCTDCLKIISAISITREKEKRNSNNRW